MEHNNLRANILLHDLLRWCKYTFTYPSLLQEYSYLRKQVRSHDTVSKFAYVSNFTYVSKCVHVNGALINKPQVHNNETTCFPGYVGTLSFVQFGKLLMTLQF